MLTKLKTENLEVVDHYNSNKQSEKKKTLEYFQGTRQTLANISILKISNVIRKYTYVEQKPLIIFPSKYMGIPISKRKLFLLREVL